MDAVPIVQDAAKKPQANAKRARCHPLVFSYDESPSGIDSNLLILLHGLGDTNLPFQRLGKQLAGNLPQTAVLSLRGASAVPFLDQPGYSWWQVWDDIGQGTLRSINTASHLSDITSHPLSNAEIDPPNPSTFLSAFSALLDHLTAEVSKGGCGWPASAIHLFGFGQGASAALEGAIRWTQADRGEEKKITELDEEARSSQPKRRVGSIVSICGGLISVSQGSGEG